MKRYLRSIVVGLVLIAGIAFAGEWLQTDSTNRFYKVSWNEYDAVGPSTVWNAYSDSVDNVFNKLWRDAPINIKSDYGAVGDGVTVDTAAFNSGIDAILSAGQGELVVPAGTYVLDAQIIKTITENNKHISIRGMGTGNTFLKWTSSPGGFRFDFPVAASHSDYNEISIKDLSILTTIEGGGTAIDLRFAEPGGQGRKTVSIRDITIRGYVVAVSPVQYWTKGIYLSGAYNSDLSHIQMMGRIANGYAAGTVGLDMIGNTIDAVIENIRTWHYETDIKIRDGVEGVRIKAATLIAGKYGVDFRPSVGGDSLLILTESHISAKYICVYLENLEDVHISENSFWNRTGVEGNGFDWRGVGILSGVGSATITDNYFYAAVGASGQTSWAVKSDGDNIQIVDNIASNTDSMPIWLATNSSNNLVSGNLYKSCTSTGNFDYIQNDGTINIVEGFRYISTIDNSDASSSGTGEDTLQTLSIVANTMGATGGLRILAAGTKTGGNDDKTIKLYWGSSGWEFNAAANDTNDWRVEAVIFNTATNAQRISWQGWNGATPLQGYETETEDTTAAVTLKITGECAHVNDVITQTMWIVERM